MRVITPNDTLATATMHRRALGLAALLVLLAIGGGLARPARGGETPLADPALDHLTFLGGSNNDFANGVAIDGAGNRYVVGSAGASWGSPVRAFAVGPDVFVAKLDADGALVWNTFLGGGAGDSGAAIAVDPNGNLYVAGKSRNAWGTPVRGFQGDHDNAFVAKLDASGALLWNTFLGPSTGYASASGIAVAVDGSVAVAGSSVGSWGAPVRPFSGSNSDVFVAELDGAGNLLWNTFLGSSSIDFANGLATGASGELYVSGTSSASWGSPVRAFTVNSELDAFAAEVSPAGVLVWNTFLGGGEKDGAALIAFDASGRLFIAGQSDGTWGNPRRAYSVGHDAFAAALATNGTLLWNTFLGGSGYDAATGVVGDGSGNAFIVGFASAAWGSPVAAYSGGDDGFAAELDDTGELAWSTFFGGAADDDPTGAAFRDGRLAIAGESSAGWGAPVRPHAGAYDGFLVDLRVSGTGNHCVASATTLCLDDRPGDRRFAVTIDFQTSQGGGRSGQGHPVPLSSLGVTRGGLFWFFDPSNPELLVKVLNGCSVNGHYWVFYSAGTNVGLTLTVTDTTSGVVFERTNADLHAVATVQNLAAFPCN